MSCRFRFALLLLAGWAASSPAAAGTMGPLERFLLLGAEGVWEGTLSEEGYRLENKDAQAAGETRYAFLDPHRDDNRFWTIAVEVKLQPASAEGAYSFGGIVCAVESQPRSYLVFAIDSEGRLGMYRRNQEGLRPVKIYAANPSDPRAFNELRVVEQEGRYRIFVNGEAVRTIETDLAGTGGVGIIAGGTGGFLYRDFALAPSE